MIIFALYHRATARPDRGHTAPFRFLSFFYLTIPSTAAGVGLALIPIIIVDSLIAVLIKGDILTYSTAIFNCYDANPSNCVYTFFDLIKDTPGKISVDYQLLRNGRCGIAILFSGGYLLMVGLKILVPDTTKPGRIYEAYNGNVWLYYVWKRSNMVYCSFWIILFCVALI